MDEYYCPNCNAILNHQYGFDPDCGAWTCTSCGQLLMDDDVYEGDSYEGIVWFCDDCGALLNRQSGFKDNYDSWACTECGHRNEITEDNIEDGHTFAETLGDILGHAVFSAFVASREAKRLEKESERLEQEQRRKEEEQRRKEEELYKETLRRERKEKRKRFWKKHWTKLIIGCLLLVIVFVGAYIYYQCSKLIPIVYDKDDLLGGNYEKVYTSLVEAGFTNVHCCGVENITMDEVEKENTVFDIIISDSNDFSADEKFLCDMSITIKYHMMIPAVTPLSYENIIGLIYSDVATMFEEAGFVNITCVAANDLITGWIHKDGEISDISIAGDSEFYEGKQFRPDDEVIITYHTFKKLRK